MPRRDDANDPDDRAALDALRERVYGPDATEDDRARLRAASTPAARRPAERTEHAARAVRPVEQPSPTAVQEGRRRRLSPGSLLLASAVVVVVITAALLGVGTGVLPAPGPVPERPATLPVTGEERTDFIDRLLAGGAGGLSAYLVTHPSPPALRTATRFDTVELKGIGSRTLRVARPEEAGRGRATVLLVLASGGDATWRIERTTSVASDAPVVARRGGRQEAGVPTTATFALPSALTTVRLHVDAPAGVRWGVAVVFSD